MTRILHTLLTAVLSFMAWRIAAAESNLALGIAPGAFAPTMESLTNYHCADWFRDAKFGMWAHWGPQSAAEFGDWYARNIYIQDSGQNKYHVETYGHPSKFGFKDVALT